MNTEAANVTTAKSASFKEMKQEVEDLSKKVEENAKKDEQKVNQIAKKKEVDEYKDEDFEGLGLEIENGEKEVGKKCDANKGTGKQKKKLPSTANKLGLISYPGLSKKPVKNSKPKSSETPEIAPKNDGKKLDVKAPKEKKQAKGAKGNGQKKTAKKGPSTANVIGNPSPSNVQRSTTGSDIDVDFHDRGCFGAIWAKCRAAFGF